jgi:hypothetical protein
MNRPVHTSATEQRTIGGVDDSIHRQLGNIARVELNAISMSGHIHALLEAVEKLLIDF